MEKLENLAFNLNGKDYELGFTMASVKSLGNYSIQRRGNISTVELIKSALQVTKGLMIVTDKLATEVTEALEDNVLPHGDDELNFEEVIQYVITLFVQTIDEEAKKHEPSEVFINEDGTSKVIYKEREYKLLFNRKDLEEQFNENTVGFNNLLELYAVGSHLVKSALKSGSGYMNTRLHEEIFMSLWNTKIEGTEDSYVQEVINGLFFHAKKVTEEAVKKSKAVIKPIQH